MIHFPSLSLFPSNLLGWRMFAEALLECQKSSVLPMPFCKVCHSPFICFAWTDGKGGGLKLKIEMMLNGDEIDT